MTDREKEIVDEALEYNWILKERGDVNYPDDITVDTFTEGVIWAENNPSEETINKFIDLFYDANEEVRLHMVGNRHFENARKIQIKYIKEHWKKNSI